MIDVGRDGVWRHEGEPVQLEPGTGFPGHDVVFPVLHGPFGEDGTVQGLLECLDVPYVGAGVLASAACMHKVLFKELMAQAGIPQVDYRAVSEAEHRADPDRGPARARAARVSDVRQAGPPRILGRDRRVAATDELSAALDTAFVHDSLAIVEAAAVGREIECSVIGNEAPFASEPGEILLAAGEDGWYDYEAKYSPGGMRLVVPARVPEDVRDRVRELAVEAFARSGCAGLARVDFFVVGDQVLLNELNTMPGFTQTSVFGTLFAASGIPYSELLDRLVKLAFERHQAERAHRF